MSQEGKQIELKTSDFVHLHNHTHFSLLDGLTKIDELVNFVKDNGMEAVAVTDHGTMSGLVELYTTAKTAGIKPILGMEAYVAVRRLEDRDPAYDKKRYHVTLLAANNKGFENLSRLISEAEIRGKYYKPRIDHEIMEKYNEGIICLSGCAGSEISMAIRDGDEKKAEELARWYSEVYKDRFYLEMQDHGHPEAPAHWDEQAKINAGLEKISKKTGLPLVVTCDAHYVHHEDKDAHEVLLCVGTGSNLSDTNRMSLKEFNLNVVPAAEVIERWGKTNPEAVLNTKKIADQCNVELELGRVLIPKFPVPTDQTEKEYLHTVVFRGLAERYGILSKEKAAESSVEDIRPLLSDDVLERIDMELDVVAKMGYEGYFLIVWDFIAWGKSQGIVFGPGRGSAAGALLAYALYITDINPLEYDLLFERFLNPDRISMPDIDTDIQDTRRDEVIEYCAQKYGSARVSNIVTFGKMMAKNAVRDAARVLEVPYAEADRIAKLVPDPIQGRHIKLKEAVKDDPDLKKEYESNPTSREVFDYAMRLEGTIRSHGVHACGVVIAPDDLVKYLPLEVSAKGPIATQFPMTQVEDLGLLKMDFLGLSNLTIINNAIRIVRKVYNEDIDLANLPMDDEKTFELFREGNTTGVFQLESAGMKRYLRELKPNSFNDIIAMVALYRPGPMQFIDSYIRRKHGEEEVAYLHPGLENSLKDTYGILIYQEQFMQASKEWCGFTGGQADTLRKAVGKKKIKLMEEVKPQFIEGAQKVGGASKEIAETFWDQLLEFANYCFNKSHAASYGLVAYWTAYIKAHYPSAFMAALMTSDSGDTDRLAIEISECRKMGINVLSPDINQSYAEFAVVPGSNDIRFGLTAVKGVGATAVELIEESRKKDGEFKSIEDFARRSDARLVNRKVWESLIRAGAFDKFASRSDLLFNLDSIIAFSQKVQKEAASGQADLFGMLGDSSENLAGAVSTLEIQPSPQGDDEHEKLMWERELLGLYLSAHPLDDYDIYLSEQTVPLSKIKPENNNQQAVVGGVIMSVRQLTTKNGGKMAFVHLEDKGGEMEVIVFPGLFQSHGDKIKEDAVVKIQGKVSGTDRDGNMTTEAQIIANDITTISLDEAKSYNPTGKTVELGSAPPSKKKSYSPKNNQHANNGDSKQQQNPSASIKQATTESTSRSYAPVVAVDDRKLYVRVLDPNDSEKLQQMKAKMGNYPGDNQVILVLGADKSNALKLPFGVELQDELLVSLRGIYGDENVIAK